VRLIDSRPLDIGVAPNPGSRWTRVWIPLARRNSAWGFGAGFTIAVAWNSLQLFITHLVQAGAHELWILISTGQLRRPDTLLVFVGAIGQFVLIVACLVAFRQVHPGKKQWWQFLAGGLLVLAYFGAIGRDHASALSASDPTNETEPLPWLLRRHVGVVPVDDIDKICNLAHVVADKANRVRIDPFDGT
jgi:hypothetical protein